MSEIFEIRMRKEVDYLRKLQTNKDMRNILSIYAAPRTGGEYKSILEEFRGLPPVKFKVTYKMPMYVSAEKLKKDWQGTIFFEITEDALLGTDDIGISIDGGQFEKEDTPFNNHINQGFICKGNCWEVARDQGIWLFIIAIGALLNLNPEYQSANRNHLNPAAHDFLKNVRHDKPTNDIHWPYNLREQGNGFVIKTIGGDNVSKAFTIKPIQTHPTFTIKPIK